MAILNEEQKKRLYNSISLVIFVFALVFDNLNILQLPAKEAAWIGFIGMVLQLCNAGIKQYFSPGIKNKTIWINVGLFAAYLAGGLLQQFDLLPISEPLQAGIRTTLTTISTQLPKIVNQLSDKDENGEKKE